MNLSELGVLLRERRSQRHISVDDVSAHLKISARLIRDIESGSDELLPHSVYVRGFIKSYAKMIGIDEEELAPYMLVFDQVESGQPEQITNQALPVENRGSGWLFKLLFVLLFVGFGGYWYYSTYFKDTSMLEHAEKMIALSSPAAPAQIKPSQPVQPSSPVETPAQPQAAATPVSPPKATPDTSAVQAQAAAPLAPPSVAEPQPVATPASQQQPRAAQLVAASQKNTPAGSHQVLITGLAECWVHATADGTETRQFSVKKNENFALSFTNSLVLKLGNAGGVRIVYDGVEMPAEGKSGQVKTLSFPPR